MSDAPDPDTFDADADDAVDDHDAPPEADDDAGD